MAAQVLTVIQINLKSRNDKMVGDMLIAVKSKYLETIN